MQYTSGTTGFPKGVMLTHYNVVNNGKCIGDCMDLSTADRMMIHVPMFHCFGMVLANDCFDDARNNNVPDALFFSEEFTGCINQEKITCFHGVPHVYRHAGHEDFPKTEFFIYAHRNHGGKPRAL
jgi:fatty-acyl-CoA synthase